MSCCQEKEAIKLNDRVTIQTATPTNNDYGEPIVSYSTYIQRRCQVKPVSDAQTLDGDLPIGLSMYEVTLVRDSEVEAIQQEMRMIITTMNNLTLEIFGNGIYDPSKRYMIFKASQSGR